MKILTLLIGLASSAAGLYLSYYALQMVDTLEALQLGLYFTGSFVLLTIGIYLILIIFLRPKKKSPSENEGIHNEPFEITKKILSEIQDEGNLEPLMDKADDEEDLSEILTLHEPVATIGNTMVLNLFEENPVPQEIMNEEVLTEDDLEMESSDLEEEVIEIEDIDALFVENQAEELIIESDVDAFEDKYLKEHPTLENEVQEERVFNTQFDEARLIGIDGFGTQRILKKLDENTELILKINEKHGLKSAQVLYQKKVIGYLSKLDYNRIQHKLPNLYKITLSTKVYDKQKIVSVTLRLSFKN